MGTEENNISGKRPRTNLFDTSSLDTIQFSESFGGKDIRLFEIPDGILNKIKEGHELCIKGESTEGVVICTSDTTYSIKKVETSNYVFLVPASDRVRFTIDSKCNDYYEVLFKSLF